jgi:2,3,4,5-tetrahydropyridine-2,6-dicarboxylate N-succinyltransferase
VDLERTISEAYSDRERLKDRQVATAVEEVIARLDRGDLRVAEKREGEWRVNAWVKEAILLYFALRPLEPSEAGDIRYFDKIRTKTDLQAQGIRVVPPGVARYGSFLEPGCVLMPGYVNIGAYVGAGTMVDTWATVGSCAQIGRDVHLSGGVGIGGVLEPMQANPTIIEDDCFIGARSEVVEGVIVREGSVLGMGVFLGQSTKIVDRETGAITYGEVPAFSVVVSGTMPGKPLPNGEPGPALYCAVIVKRVDERTRSKTSINELLRA